MTKCKNLKNLIQSDKVFCFLFQYRQQTWGFYSDQVKVFVGSLANRKSPEKPQGANTKNTSVYLNLIKIHWCSRLYSSVVERCTCNAAAPGSNPGGAFCRKPDIWMTFCLEQIMRIQSIETFDLKTFWKEVILSHILTQPFLIRVDSRSTIQTIQSSAWNLIILTL